MIQISLNELCVTPCGDLTETNGGYLTVVAPKVRAILKSGQHPVACLREYFAGLRIFVRQP
jgi:hypothetical protein